MTTIAYTRHSIHKHLWKQHISTEL